MSLPSWQQVLAQDAALRISPETHSLTREIETLEREKQDAEQLTVQCEHGSVRETDHAFGGPVVNGTGENPAAHGNITREERCRSCGAIRLTNINGTEHEVGDWVAPTRAIEDQLTKVRRALRESRAADKAR